MKSKKQKSNNHRYQIRPLKLTSRFATMAAIVFPEHLPDGYDALIKAIKAIPPEETQVIAILHNKTAKEHWHILVRFTNNNKGNKRMVVSTMLKMLGIQYRPGIDDVLLANHGLETTGNFSEYVRYLLHQSRNAIIEGKPEYKEADLVSNLTIDEIKKLLKGLPIGRRPLTRLQLSQLEDRAYDAGYNLDAFEKFMEPFKHSGLSAARKASYRKSYLAGVKKRRIEKGYIQRVCIWITMGEVSVAENARVYESVHRSLNGKKYVDLSETTYSEIDADTNALIWPCNQTGYAYFIKKHPEFSRAYSDTIEVINDGVWAGSHLIVIDAALSDFCNFLIPVPAPFFIFSIRRNEWVRSSCCNVNVEKKEWLLSECRKFQESLIQELSSSNVDSKNRSYISLEELNS